MAKKPHFPVPPAAQTGLNTQGMLPPRPGTVMGRVPRAAVEGQKELTDSEKDILAKAGWRPGDPMPNLQGTQVGRRMQQEVDKIREKAEDYHGMSPVDPSTPPLEPPAPVDINELVGEERERAEQTFAEMDELQGRMNASRAAKAKQQTSGLPKHVAAVPGAAAAIAHAQAVSAAEEPSVSLVDDMGVTDTQGAPASPFKLKASAAEDAAPLPPSTAEPVVTRERTTISSDEQVSDASYDAPAGADLSGARTHCPQCNFELDSELIVPTDVDIAAYLSMFMGEGRFRKEVTLFGGRVRVVFRSLLPREVDAALAVVDREMKQDAVHHILQYTQMVEQLKMAAGIESVSRAGTAPIVLPTLDDIDDTSDRPAIEQLKEYLDNAVFTTDSMRRAVGTQWLRFTRLQLHIDAKAEDPDFFGKAG